MTTFDYGKWQKQVEARQAEREREAEEKATEDAERREEWRKANEAAIAAEDERRRVKSEALKVAAEERLAADRARREDPTDQELRRYFASRTPSCPEPSR